MNAPDPRTFNLPDAQYLRPDHIDNVARALITLSREVAVLVDRVLVLEELLGKAGVIAAEAVETYQPNDAFQQRVDQATGTILRNVLTALQGADGAA